MLTDQQARNLIKLLEEAEKPLYIFMDDHDTVIESEWLEDDQAALEYAKTINLQAVHILKAIGIVERGRDTWLFDKA